MGVEVQTARHWARAEEADLSRVVFVNMLDRERADFFRVLDALREQLSDKCVAVHIPIGAEHELKGIVDLLHMQAYMDPGGQRESGPTEIPAELKEQVDEYREKLLDAVVETDEGLMERYLDGQELDAEEVAKALKDAVTRGEVFPVACGVASKNLGTTALLDLLVEGVPSPARKGAPISVDGGGTAASSSRRSRTRSPAASTCSGFSTAPSRATRTSSMRAGIPRSASGSCSKYRARSTPRCRSSARAISGPSRS